MSIRHTFHKQIPDLCSKVNRLFQHDTWQTPHQKLTLLSTCSSFLDGFLCRYRSFCQWHGMKFDKPLDQGHSEMGSTFSMLSNQCTFQSSCWKNFKLNNFLDSVLESKMVIKAYWHTPSESHIPEVWPSTTQLAEQPLCLADDEKSPRNPPIIEQRKLASAMVKNRAIMKARAIRDCINVWKYSTCFSRPC